MIVIVVPCFNEAKRINMSEFLKFAHGNLYFVFADDGSTDGTTDYIRSQSQANQNIKVLRFDKNVGKANVIYNAFQKIFSQPSENLFSHNIAQAEWFGYWDADLSTPLYEIQNMISYSQFYEDDYKSVWGSRIYKLGSQIKRSNKRHYLGRLFATVAHLLLKIESYDSQCGAKLFKRDVCHVAFQKSFISRWLFDVEILLRLQNHKIIEYPLKEWTDIEGSKVKIFKESYRILLDLFLIRSTYKK